MQPSTNMIKEKEIQHRIELICDGMIGTSFHLSDPKVFVYPFTDYLYLLFQRPLVFSFWRDQSCIFSSFADPYFRKVYEEYLENESTANFLNIPNSPYSLTIQNFAYEPPEKIKNGSCGSTRNFKDELLKIDNNAMRIVSKLLISKHPFMVNVFEILTASLDMITKPQIFTLPNETLNIDYNKTVLPLLERLRRVFDEAFSEASESSHLKIYKGDFDIAKIFAVVKTIQGPNLRYYDSFPYTAGLILSEKQRSNLERWCKSGCKVKGASKKEHCPVNCDDREHCLNYLEYPLGLHSRSVADCVFSSGIVDFGREAGDRMWDVVGLDDENDRKRQIIERCIYPEGSRLFYSPIHVGGTPWLAIFTFTDYGPSTDPNKDWLHNYSFYRDVIQKAASLIRFKAHSVYESLVAERVEKEMADWLTSQEERLKKLNESMQQLAQVYPFPFLQFHRQPPAKAEHKTVLRKLNVPGRGSFHVTVEPNPFFAQQVEWNTGDSELILDHCQSEIGKFVTFEERVGLNVTAQTSHLLKNELAVLYNLSRMRTPGRHDLLMGQIQRILDLHKVAAAIMSREKHEQLRAQYKQSGTFENFKIIITECFDETLRLLVEAAVSGNMSTKLKGLLDSHRLQTDFSIPPQWARCNIQYFKPSLVFILQGLVSNAIRYVGDTLKDKVTIRMNVEEINSEVKIFLDVINTTQKSKMELEQKITTLNSPGPDLIGITELHWVCRAFWGEHASPRWELVNNLGYISIRARAQIAEVVKCN